MKVPKGVSSHIDSCSGMIAQSVARQYHRLTEEHRRWIDPEDVLQEAFIAALEAEGKYDPGCHTKFSTYLYTGLTFGYSRSLNSPLRQKKRLAKAVVELDAPVTPDDDSLHRSDLLLEPHHMPDELMAAVQSLLLVCRSLSPRAVLLLVKGLLLGQSTVAAPELTQELATVCHQSGVSAADLRVVGHDVEAKNLALAALSGMYTMGLGSKIEKAYDHKHHQLKILECVLCHGRFDLGAIQSGQYFVENLLCAGCCAQLAQDAGSCFGKKYDKEAAECQEFCPDQKICPQYIKKGLGMKKSVTVEEVENLDVDAVQDEPDPAPAKKKKAKVVEVSVAKAKPAGKAANAVKARTVAKKKKAADDDEVPPTEVGSRWPYKKGSTMRYCFQRALKGVKLANLKREVENSGHSWDLMLKALRLQASGKQKITHRWKLDEENGFLRVYDVKPQMDNVKAAAGE